MALTMSASTDRLREKVMRLKEERRAVILSHNYQAPEIQDIADFIGDSLELSQKAAKTDANVILFCGVHFMAETAAILCPDKIVLMPDLQAGCSMADMIEVETLRALKAEHPDAVVVCYVNTAAEIKAESDICCTSSNAVKVVNSLPPDREIIFVPDKFLGQHVMNLTGRKMILYNGYCPTHFRIMSSDVEKMKEAHPDAEVLAHPECTGEVRAVADLVLSTGGMCREVKNSQAQEVIVGTEIGMLHRLRKENPEKKIFAACQWCDCGHMKVNTLEKVLWSLEDMEYRVAVPEEIRVKAKRAVDRMLTVV